MRNRDRACGPSASVSLAVALLSFACGSPRASSSLGARHLARRVAGVRDVVSALPQTIETGPVGDSFEQVGRRDRERAAEPDDDVEAGDVGSRLVLVDGPPAAFSLFGETAKNPAIPLPKRDSEKRARQDSNL